MTLSILLYIFAVFFSVFTLGTVLCLALYKWDYRRFFRSSLWVKTAFWLPIFIIYVLVLYLELPAALIVWLLITALAAKELFRQPTRPWFAQLYTAVVLFGMAQLLLFFISFEASLTVSLLLVVAFGSVFSDVCAYFFGNFFGKHRLPRWINPGKNWEGVVGQFVGAFIGFVAVLPVFPTTLPLWLALVIGAASAFGDLTNSVVKRKLGVKDWGNTIPGHGGVLDRFSSMSLAIAATFWCAFIFLV